MAPRNYFDKSSHEFGPPGTVAFSRFWQTILLARSYCSSRGGEEARDSSDKRINLVSRLGDNKRSRQTVVHATDATWATCVCRSKNTSTFVFLSQLYFIFEIDAKWRFYFVNWATQHFRIQDQAFWIFKLLKIVASKGPRKGFKAFHWLKIISGLKEATIYLAIFWLVRKKLWSLNDHTHKIIDSYWSKLYLNPFLTRVQKIQQFFETFFLRSSVVLGVSFFLLITVLEHASTKWCSRN